MTATFSMAELEAQGFKLVGDRLVRVAARDTAGVHLESPDERDEQGSWKDAQTKCRKVFVDGGCEVYWLSQARQSGQTPGLPDLIVFGPPGAPFLLMFEVKHGRGALSPAQKQFALHCQRSQTRYAAGGASVARRILKELAK